MTSPLVFEYQGLPERLDRVLAGLVDHLSRSRIQALIHEGHVLVDQKIVRDANHRVMQGAHLQMTVPEAASAEPVAQHMTLDIVYEDEDILVLNKPAGLVVHPGAGHEDGTLVNALLAHCGDSLSGIGGVKRPGIVHRLDKDTTGLMVVAKNDLAHQGLSEQFADHGRTGPLERVYLGFVWGKPPDSGTIEAPLGRHPHHREKMAVMKQADKGRFAITHFETLDTYYAEQTASRFTKRTLLSAEPLVSLIRCQLETGRTHQIRVHMAFKGFPLLGDDTYGGAFKTRASKLEQGAQQALLALDRQALHAAVLGFSHPRSGKTLYFETDLPEDLQQLKDTLEGEAGI